MSLKSKPTRGIRHRWSAGFFWTSTGAIISQGLALVSFIVIARLLGKETYGQFGILQSTMITLASVAQVAMGATARKYVAEFRSTDYGKLGRIIGLCSRSTTISGAAASVLLILFSGLLADKWLKVPSLSIELQLTSIYVFFVTINGYQIGVMQGLEEFKKLAFILTLKGVVTIVLVVLFGLFWGLRGTIIAMGLMAVIVWLINYYVLRSYCRQNGIIVTWNVHRSDKKILSNFAVPAALSGWIMPTAIWISNSFLVRNAGLIEMAVFFAFWNIRSAALFIPQNIMLVANSILNNLLGEGQARRYYKLFWANVILVSGFAAFIVVILAIFMPYIMRLYGKEFANGFIVGIVVFSSSIVECFSMGIYQSIQNRGKMWLQFGIIGLWGISLMVFSWFWTKSSGALGLGKAYLFSWSITAVIYIIFAMRIEPSLFKKE